jgi:hypothetical protein
MTGEMGVAAEDVTDLRARESAAGRDKPGKEIPVVTLKYSMSKAVA